jgi:hypothetical protein
MSIAKNGKSAVNSAGLLWDKIQALVNKRAGLVWPFSVLITLSASELFEPPHFPELGKNAVNLLTKVHRASGTSAHVVHPFGYLP